MRGIYKNSTILVVDAIIIINVAIFLIVLDHRITCLEHMGCSFPHYEYQHYLSYSLVLMLFLRASLGYFARRAKQNLE